MVDGRARGSKTKLMLRFTTHNATGASNCGLSPSSGISIATLGRMENGESMCFEKKRVDSLVLSSVLCLFHARVHQNIFQYFMKHRSYVMCM
jgi:hypothetical protein